MYQSLRWRCEENKIIRKRCNNVTKLTCYDVVLQGHCVTEVSIVGNKILHFLLREVIFVMICCDYKTEVHTYVTTNGNFDAEEFYKHVSNHAKYIETVCINIDTCTRIAIFSSLFLRWPTLICHRQRHTDTVTVSLPTCIWVLMKHRVINPLAFEGCSRIYKWLILKQFVVNI